MFCLLSSLIYVDGDLVGGGPSTPDGSISNQRNFLTTLTVLDFCPSLLCCMPAGIKDSYRQPVLLKILFSSPRFTFLYPTGSLISSKHCDKEGGF